MEVTNVWVVMSQHGRGLSNYLLKGVFSSLEGAKEQADKCTIWDSSENWACMTDGVYVRRGQEIIPQEVK